MNRLFIISLVVLTGYLTARAQATLLVRAGSGGWSDPVYSHDGSLIAFTNASANQVRFLIPGEDSTRQIVDGAGVGQRFAFEPDDKRLVFRRQVVGLPEKPVRLFSVSLYLYDPIGRTSNLSGTVFGPYYFEGKIWYRYSLLSEFVSYDGKTRKAGPYMDLPTGQLWVLNSSGDSVFVSLAGQRFAGMEMSPDGQWVAAIQAEPDIQLVLIPLAAGKVHVLEHAAAPGWSGDSKHLICVRLTNPKSPELCLVDLPSGSLSVVYSSDQNPPETPALNSDASRAAFVSGGSIYEIKLLP
jgi:Tol biopolymer transport system component